MQVVGRVSLSPKHSVYLLRIGRRVLLVGAGPQGAPSLIAELDDLPGSRAEPEDREVNREASLRSPVARSDRSWPWPWLCSWRSW